MDTTSNSDQVPERPLLQPSPVRILVQTLTHLVPCEDIWQGSPYTNRIMTMFNRVCQHVWNCEFDENVHRWYTYGDDFGYNNRRCFFLVDYGTSANDDGVPVLCYDWTGETFNPLPQLLQSKEVQDELKATPFTPRPYEPRSPPPVREKVRKRLRKTQKIMDKDLEYMKEHPEDMEWLQRKVKPRFWEEFLTQMESRPKERDEEEKRRAMFGPD